MTTPRLQVEILTDAARFEALRDEWRELLANSVADSIFLTWEWMFTWWQTMSGRHRLHLVTVREAGQLIAIAPLMRCRPSIKPLRAFATIEFIGSGDVGADYLDVIVRRGHEGVAKDALAGVLSSHRRVVHLTRVAHARAAAASLVAPLESQGWSSEVTHADACPIIRLTGQNWTSYFDGLRASHRKNMRRAIRAAETSFTVDLSVARTEDERREALATLVRLHNDRWQGRGGTTAFHSRQLVNFHEAVTRLCLERGWLRLFVLRLNGEPVAALYGITYGRRFHFYQSGFNAAFSRFSVGQMLVGMTIRHAFEDGLEEYDFLHGEEAYKFLWTDERRDLDRVEFYPPHTKGQICRAVVATRRVAGRVVRRLVSAATLGVELGAELTGNTQMENLL